MQLDSSLYYGFFTFYLGHGFAVDDELHRFVIESANTSSTASIEKKLKRMAYDAYYEDHQLYLTAIGLKKIRPRKKQKTIKDLLPAQVITGTELQHLLNFRSRTFNELRNAKVAYTQAFNKSTSDWSFKAMINDKDNHNVHGRRNYLPGLGSTKLRKLMEAGIETCQELLSADPRNFPNIKPFGNWQRVVESYYDSLKAVASGKKIVLEMSQARYNEAMDDLVVYQDEHGQLDALTEPPVNAQEETPSMFSDFKDLHGFNGRILSKYRIDSMVMSVFNHRQSFQELKMQGLTAKLLKIDFNYKLAEKIHVWTKAGCSFSPYKCIVTIQNEDSLTFF
jgi:hypothetical protein